MIFYFLFLRLAFCQKYIFLSEGDSYTVNLDEYEGLEMKFEKSSQCDHYFDIKIPVSQSITSTINLRS